ncbi:Arfaptin-like domain-containing protein [Zopfochytrium polystomum]|nr:Arfaptin-like domain-containing protein [Zopfochytrium polystomum]
MADDDGAAGSGTGSAASGRSRTQSFVDRMDQAVTEFLQKSKSQLVVNTPPSIESNFRYFQQRLKERMGPKIPGVHITAQPEVDEAAKEVQTMYSYFDELDKLVEKQLFQLKALNETEQELALFFQQKGYQESIEEISAMSIDIGKAYSDGVKMRATVITAVESFSSFVKTFKTKAIQDSIDTMKRQETARVEFDGYGAKLESVQRGPGSGAGGAAGGGVPATTILGKEHVSVDPAVQSAAEREAEHAKTGFAAAKQRYQNLSTAIIDKAVLLEMKRDVDYRVQLEKLMRVRLAIAGRGGVPGVGGGGGTRSSSAMSMSPPAISAYGGSDGPDYAMGVGGAGVGVGGVGAMDGTSAATAAAAAARTLGGAYSAGQALGDDGLAMHESVDLYAGSGPAAYQVPMSD